MVEKKLQASQFDFARFQTNLQTISTLPSRPEIFDLQPDVDIINLISQTMSQIQIDTTEEELVDKIISDNIEDKSEKIEGVKQKMEDIISQLRQEYKDIRIEVFGSALTQLTTSQSDIDLTVISFNRKVQNDQEILFEVSKILQQNQIDVDDSLLFKQLYFPLIKFNYLDMKVEMSVNNIQGVINSWFMSTYLNLSPLFKKCCIILKK